MSGDGGRHQVLTSCLMHGAPRLVRTIHCAVAIVKRQKRLRDSSAANQRHRQSYWQSFLNWRATLGCLLWASFAFTAFGDSAGVPLPALAAHNADKSSNNIYAKTDGNPDQSGPLFASTTPLTSFGRTFPEGSSLVQPGVRRQTTGSQILASGPQGNIQNDGQSKSSRTAVTPSSGERRTRDTEPTTPRATEPMGWDTFLSLMGGHQEQTSTTPTKGTTVVLEGDERFPKASAGDNKTSAVHLLPDSVAEVAVRAQGASAGPDAQDEAPFLNKGAESQSNASDHIGLGHESSAKMASLGTREPAVRLAPGDQLSRREKDEFENKPGRGKDMTKKNLLVDPNRQPPSVLTSQELISLSHHAERRATFSAAEKIKDRNSGLETHGDQGGSATFGNAAEETGPATSIESRALENILMKMLQQSTLSESRAVAQQGQDDDSRQKLVLRSLDGESFSHDLAAEQQVSTEPRATDWDRTKATESRALETILMKMLAQSRVPKDRELRGESDDEHSLILRLFDGDNLALSNLPEEHPGLAQSRDDDAAVATTRTSTTEDLGGLRGGSNSSLSKGPSAHEGLPPSPNLTPNGLRSAVRIREPTPGSGKEDTAAPQSAEQINGSVPIPGASLLVSLSRNAKADDAHLPTRFAHDVRADRAGERSPASLPLAPLPTTALRRKPPQDDTPGFSRGTEVVLNSRSEKTDADDVKHLSSDHPEQQEEFLRLLLSPVRSKGTTSGMTPSAEGILPVNNVPASPPSAEATLQPVHDVPALPSSEEGRETSHSKREGRISPTSKHAPEVAALSSTMPHPHVRATSAEDISKSGLGKIQQVREEAEDTTMQWSLPQKSKEGATPTELEAQTGDAFNMEAPGNAVSSVATSATPPKHEANVAGKPTKTAAELPSPPETGITEKSAVLVDKSKDLPPADGSTPAFKAGADRRAHAPVRESLTGAHPPPALDRTTIPTTESFGGYPGSGPGKEPVLQRPLDLKPQTRGPVDLGAVVSHGDTSTFAEDSATVPVATKEKKRKRRVRFQLPKADAVSHKETKDDALGESVSTKVGKREVIGLRSHSDEAVKPKQQVATMVTQQQFPDQVRLGVHPGGIDPVGRMVDLSFSESTKMSDSALETPEELLLQKRRLLSTISDLIDNVGSGIRPFAAFLDKEEPEDQSGFLKVSSTYPEVLRGFMFFRHPSWVTAVSVKRLHGEVRTCDSMVKSLQRAVNLLEVEASSTPVKEGLCTHLLMQKLNVAKQSVRTAQLFARVFFTSYQLACYYVREKRFKDALNEAATVFRDISQIYSIFADALLPAAPVSRKLSHDAVEKVCPFHQHQDADLLQEEISLHRELVEHLGVLAQEVEVASRLEAALQKLTTLLDRRPRIQKPSPPDVYRTKTRGRARKRMATVYGG